jgi:predicted metal-dependent phosphoesterase TrpH
MQSMQSVLFQKPDHSFLAEQGYTAVDMHNHSCYSDTTTKLHLIAKKARTLGIGVCLSDHNEVAGNIRLAKENPDLFVVPGMEVTTKEMAHVLMYFYSHNEMQHFFDTHIKDARHGNPHLATRVSVSDLVDISKAYNCVLAPAHPFAFPKRFSFVSAMQRGFVDTAILKSLDAVEVISGENLRMMNTKAVAWAAELQKATVGGSDAHTLNALGRVVTVNEESTVENFLDAIKKKQTQVIGKEARFYQRPLPYAKIASKNLKYFRPTMKVQYELSVRAPVMTARKMFHNKFGAPRREEHRDEIRAGMRCFSEELQFTGFPRIKKPLAMRMLRE